MRERREADREASREYQRRWNRNNSTRVNAERREKSRFPLDVAVACERCGTGFKRKVWQVRFCETCRPEVNAERNRARVGEWMKKNRPRRNAYLAKRYAENPIAKLNLRMSTLIRSSLKSGKGGRSWTTMVPYSVDDLKRHLERQFLPGMSWENAGKWHIDHILPLAMFSYESPEDADFHTAWALTNLRPLWAIDNCKKHAKRLFIV